MLDSRVTKPEVVVAVEATDSTKLCSWHVVKWVQAGHSVQSVRGFQRSTQPCDSSALEVDPSLVPSGLARVKPLPRCIALGAAAKHDGATLGHGSRKA